MHPVLGRWLRVCTQNLSRSHSIPSLTLQGIKLRLQEVTLKTGLVFFLPQGVENTLWSHWGNFSLLGSWTCVAVKTLFLESPFLQGCGHDKVAML